MAQKKAETQLLRKAFDTAYSEIDHLQNIDQQAVKEQIRRTARANRRVLILSFTTIAISILLVATMYALDAYFEYLAWQNRPTFAERIAAPYDLEEKWAPYLLNAVTVDAQVEEAIPFTTANIAYYSKDEQPIATHERSIVVKLQSIVPTTIGDFTLQWDRKQSSLLSNCLVLTGATEQESKCATEFDAEFIETANFLDADGNNIALVMTKYATDEQAASNMNSMYRYARRIGRIGNFALTDMAEVDYFYSATRAASSFTWVNQNWVISVSAGDFVSIDKFMEAFPLYENNPSLGQIVVEQIPATSPEPIIEEVPVVVPETTPEVTAEATEETTETATE